jgi:hypothetical protein
MSGDTTEPGVDREPISPRADHSMLKRLGIVLAVIGLVLVQSAAFHDVGVGAEERPSVLLFAIR